MRFLSGITFLLLFLVPAAANACSCASVTREEALQNADLVFLGKAEKSIPGENERVAVFSVDNVFKGVSGPGITVSTPGSSAACGQSFEEGQTYLVYTTENDDLFVTTVCNGNKMNPGANLIRSLGEPVMSFENRDNFSCPAESVAAKNLESGICDTFKSACEVPEGWQRIDACAATGKSFSDVNEDHPYHDAILWFFRQGYIGGFPDGEFKPDRKISRAAFIKIIIESHFSKAVIANCPVENVFKDVSTDQWFAPYVCVAKTNGIISGFDDGTFRPGKNIAFPAAAKIIVELNELGEGKTGGEWYENYVLALSARKAIPTTIETVRHEVSRGEVAEMVWRIKKSVTDRPAGDGMAIMNNNCIQNGYALPPNIDYQRVREAWLAFYNTERRAAGLPKYRYDQQLQRTAIDWSTYAANRGYHDHKRPGQSAYYDYRLIENWFATRGLEFLNAGGITFTENIGWGPWRCDAVDCTQKMIDSIRTTFDFYLAEKNQSSRPHYDAIFSSGFRKLGLGIALNPEGNKYFLTVHFGTEITSDPPAVCET